jgi:hypothetical protein
VCQSRTTAAGQPRPVTEIADTPSPTTDLANKGKLKENDKNSSTLSVPNYKDMHVHKEVQFFNLKIRRSKNCYNRILFVEI